MKETEPAAPVAAHPRSLKQLVTACSSPGYIGLLIPALALGLALQVIAIRSHVYLNHDDSISLLAATGHLGEYQEMTESGRYPANAWAPAAAWHRYLEVEDVLPFGRIARDLAVLDIHPPLYFWLLHLWLLVVGSSLPAAPTLNVALTLLTGAALFGLARQVLASRVQAAAVVLVWAAGPAVADTTLFVRPYSLLTLWTVLLAHLALRSSQPEPAGKRTLTVLLLAGVVLAGLLTQYQFALYLAGALVVVVGRSLTHPRQLAGPLLAVATAVGVFWLSQPLLPVTLARQRLQAQDFTLADAGPRAARAGTELSRLFSLQSGTVLQAVLAAVVVGGLVGLWYAWRRDPRSAERISQERAIVFLTLWIAGAIVATYVASVSPRHAMGARYLSAAWPFIAFLPVLFWRALPAWHTAAASVGAVALVASATVTALAYLPARSSPAAALGTTEAVVFDNLAPGMLPRTAWHVPATTPIYAATQRQLLQEPVWRTHPRTVLVSQAAFGSSVGGRGRILRYLEQRGTVRPVPTAFQPHTEVYRFQVPSR